MEIKKYLPSKQFMVRIASLLIIAGGTYGVIFVFEYIQKRNLEKTAGGAEEGEVIILEGIFENDRDKDGVPDFEEILFQTDPDKAETTPGLADKTYIDNLKVKLELENTEVSGEKGSINETEQFAQEFFNSIVALQQADAITPETSEKLAESFFDYIDQYPEIDVYTKDSFSVVKDSNDSLVNYFKKIQPILEKNPMNGDSSMTIAGLALQELEFNRLKQIAPITKSYEKTVTDLKKIAVPESLVENHVKIVNGFDKLGRYTKTMQSMEKDPMLALVAIGRYPKTLEELISSMTSLSLLIK